MRAVRALTSRLYGVATKTAGIHVGEDDNGNMGIYGGIWENGGETPSWISDPVPFPWTISKWFAPTFPMTVSMVCYTGNHASDVFFFRVGWCVCDVQSSKRIVLLCSTAAVHMN